MFRRDFLDRLRSNVEQKGDSLVCIYGVSKTTKAIVELEKNESDIRLSTNQISLGKLNFQRIPHLINEVKKQDPDIILMHPRVAIADFYGVALLAKFRGIKLIIWDGGYQRLDLSKSILKIKRWLMAFFYSLADVRLCYSYRQHQELISNKINSFPAQNTIDVHAIKRKQGADFSNKKATNIIYFGAITELKRLDKLINVVKVLHSKYEDIHLSIVGPHSKTSQNLFQNLTSEERKYIKFDGPIYGDKLISHTHEYGIFVMPGIGGLAVNEAMANGLVVLSTEGDGTIIDLLDESYSGFLLPHNCSKTDILRPLTYLINLPEKDFRERCKASQSRILIKASLDGMVNGFLEAIYE